MERKFCIKCSQIYAIDKFTISKQSKDGYAPYCQLCRSEINKKSYERHKEKRLAEKRGYYERNRELVLSASRESYNKHKKERLRHKQQYYLDNKTAVDLKHRQYLSCNELARSKKSEYNREYDKQRKQYDPLFRLRKQLRTLIHNHLKIRGYRKTSKTIDMLGCSINELADHLGPKPSHAAHIDHICPCSQAQNEDELIKLQHYSNLRWLNGTDNMAKSNKPTEEAVQKCIEILNRDWIIRS